MAHFIRDDEKESDIGFIFRVSGPLVDCGGNGRCCHVAVLVRIAGREWRKVPC